MEQINDLNGIRKLFIGNIPDPLGPIPNDYLARSFVEPSALRFSFQPLSKFRKRFIHIRGSRTLDGRVIPNFS